MTMCFDCQFKDIQETAHEWIECKCKKDGKMHSPYRPMGILIDCPDWQKEENEELQTIDGR